MSFLQYLKDTRGELHHVAWPTQLQTIVYTIMVVLLSVFIALYLGFFDFIFTTGLARSLPLLSHKTTSPQVTTATTTPQVTVTPITTASTTVPITPLKLK